MAASRPSTAWASVRAMMTNCASVRASTAALMRSHISAVLTSSLPGRCPQRLACTWSSRWQPAAPARFHFLDGARDHQGAAPAGVRIHEQRQRRRLRDAPDVLADIVQGRETEVGQAERRIRHARAGKVKRTKARALREHRAVGVDRADDLQRPLRFDSRTQPGTGR